MFHNTACLDNSIRKLNFFQIYGYDKFSSSVYLIENGLLKLSGVLDITLPPDESIVKCVYDPLACGPRDIKEAIEKLGFQAKLNTNTRKNNALAQTDEIDE